MRLNTGDHVKHPDHHLDGQVIDVQINPACLLRTLVITWENGEIEEWSEWEFGPIED
ncbi:hypothetical protein [Ferroacidibacillus organovorans]|uniref:hypothetical protein n=1 Tax=Ferroacidibacillus organovorans TaxID=1765683 RepID=UPI0012E94C55|nr:hypothetical protein [Ferroacidibacillus organovorans]